MEPGYVNRMNIQDLSLALALAIGGSVAMLAIARAVRRHPPRLAPVGEINFQIGYQSALLLLAGLVLLILRIAYPQTLSALWGIGDPRAPAAPVAWMGIGEGETWATLGPGLSAAITGVTTIFIWHAFRGSGIRLATLARYLPLVLLFAAANAFSEEVIFRLGVLVPLQGSMAPLAIILLSAVLFGIPHYRGMPNGVAGVALAAIMGGLLAKSVLETGGLFWAFAIHFLQDVVIISALVLKSAATPPGARA